MANTKYTIPHPAATAVSIPTVFVSPSSPLPSPTAELQVETNNITGQTAVVTHIVTLPQVSDVVSELSKGQNGAKSEFQSRK